MGGWIHKKFKEILMGSSIGISPTSLAALFLVLFILALAPNLSILIVTTRAATSGFRQGAWATLGITTATLVYILAAVFVLVIVADMRPEARHVLRLVAAVYLILNGMGRIRNADVGPKAMLPVTHRSAASFGMGFILTLLSVKSLVFYLSFLPLFVSPGTLDGRATLILLGVVALVTGGAKLVYVVASAGGKVVPSVMVGKALNVIAGIVVTAAGGLLATGRALWQ
jgi:threonine/homoserine/homoserine lactone efflux protein